MLSYATICDTMKLVLKDAKMPYEIKIEAQDINNILEGEVDINVSELPEVPDHAVQTSEVSAFN